ncbi:MAG: extracellular solute-binding protein [Firmicutes bacterium]|nr:extracellular solute-binding protein [Bacillota bacterium]
MAMSRKTGRVVAAISTISLCAAAPVIMGGSSAAAGHQPVTITWQLNSLTPNSPYMKVFNADIKAYERTHPWVHVKYIVTNTNTNTQQAYLVTEAAGHSVPDVTWEQYGEVTSGSIPKGILADLTPYLMKPDPYVPGNKHWIDLWTKSAIPYMRGANGQYYLLVGSQVATGIVYNKADFRAAGIKAPPATWAQWLNDMKKLKAHHFVPLLFADGGTDNCNSSWYERKFSSELLHSELSQFDVNHAQVASGLDTVVAIEKGIISMNNPAYAEGWKLLGSLRPYLAPGGSTYDACASLTATSPPLNPESLFVKGKVAMEWGGSWFLPQLNQLGFAGKYGVFPFPTITKATTKYSSNINVTGTVGGPNGVGEIAIPTPAADSSMTSYKMSQIINLLMYLYSPKVEGGWVANQGQESDIPLIIGAKAPSVPGLGSLLPKKFPPVTVEGILDSSVTTQAASSGIRLVQAYLGGDMSYSQFASQWQTVLTQAAQQWQQQNHVNVSKYLKK